MKPFSINRRDFLKLSAVGLGALALNPDIPRLFQIGSWPENVLLGRNCGGGIVNLRAKPSSDSALLNTYYEDTIVVWLKEVIGQAPSGLVSRRWVETPEGYIYAPTLQPVRNIPNKPVENLPSTSLGNGIWVKVTVPYVDLILDNPPPHSPWSQTVKYLRLYYSQILWVDQITTDSAGNIVYRVNERYGPGDIYWADARAFKPLTDEDFAPISASIENKRIQVNLTYQYLSCFEDNHEVYFCRVSSGAKFNAAGEAVDNWATPPGEHLIFRKLASMHMIGGTSGASGWDTPGIGWTSLFAQGGVAIHSTFWHNNFGVPVSHGCVNVTPEDAHWIFRWATPQVPYDPGDIDITALNLPPGTIVDVIEGS
jgi:hypothetical protein